MAGLFLLGSDQVLAEDDEGYLGVTLARINLAEGDLDRNGVYIVGIGEDSGAAKAGLRRNDLIIGIDELTITDLEDVHAALEQTKAGDEVTVTVRRNGEELEYSVGLGKQKLKSERKNKIYAKDLKLYPKDLKKVGVSLAYDDLRHAYVVDIRRASLGVQTQTLGAQLAAFLGVEEGVLVTEVTEGEQAWEVGLRAGDVIVGWNGEAVATEQQLEEYLAAAEPGDVADLEVYRRDHLETFVVTLTEAELLKSVTLTFDVSEAGPKLREVIPQD